MQMLEKIIAYIAPHYCTQCGREGQLLCEFCSTDVFGDKNNVCILCGSDSPDGRMCSMCKPATHLQAGWVLGEYEGVLEHLIYDLKFQAKREAADVLAAAMDCRLPYLPPATIVVPLPTAPRRVRQRGYDQSVLIAKALAYRRRLPYVSLLRRQHNLRQLGASRAVRIRQAGQAYRLAATPPSDSTILLVDDVLTTGASLNAAASLLWRTGDCTCLAVAAARRT